MSRVCNYSNTTGDSTSGAETAYPYGTHEFTSVFRGVRVTRSLVLRVMFCRSLFVPLSFFILPLCCLSFDLRILISHLVSSNSSLKNATHFAYLGQHTILLHLVVCGQLQDNIVKLYLSSLFSLVSQNVCPLP